MIPTPRALAWGRVAARGAGLLLFALPLAAALPLALHEALSIPAWRALWQDPAWPHMAALSLFSAVTSTLLALLATMAIVAQVQGTAAWVRVSAVLAPMLAVPHAAFAIGLAWLVSPTGEVARLLAWGLGWDAPPAWNTVHDRHALMLTLTLFLKELPFLLWSAVALLSRPEVAQQLKRQRALARTLGHGPVALWWRVLWPLWLPRLAWPVLAVLAYGLTVVDLGIVIGPTNPPTLAVSAYVDLVGGDSVRNGRGAAAALGLGAMLALLVGLAAWLWPVLRRVWVRSATRGHRGRPAGTSGWSAALLGVQGLRGIFATVIVVLGVLSVAQLWRFPNLLPQRLSLDAWAQVVQASGTLVFTAGLAAAATASALVLTVAWLEATPARWDRWAMPAVLAPLVLPGLLLMAGLYQGALYLHLDGSVGGMWWVHTLSALPYCFITLHPAWRAFDRRLEQTALALGRSRWTFWLRIKWPLLAAPLASALAVGFAVSVAQYLATQFIGAGRHPTITTEAVTLASGGQRSLAAAFALLQALLPGLAFWAAARLGAARGA